MSMHNKPSAKGVKNVGRRVCAMDEFYIAFAPLQGYTDSIYRRAHCVHAGGVSEYYTPFIRLEGGAPRRKDLRDIAADGCQGVPTVPQVIAKDREEFARLCDAVEELGWNRIDLNLGCPFPMQSKSGRGSGLLQHPAELENIAREMAKRAEVSFSVKMRLGQEKADEGLEAIRILNDIPLTHIVLHPRLGRQQYKGNVDIVSFEQLCDTCRHAMVYNGDIAGTDEIERWRRHGGKIKGVMIGRGLLARPWMLGGGNPSVVLRRMHDEVYRHATLTLCGESQILSRLHAFWEHIAIGHKEHKAVMKATSLRRYDEAVATVFSRGS